MAPVQNLWETMVEAMTGAKNIVELHTSSTVGKE